MEILTCYVSFHGEKKGSGISIFMDFSNLCNSLTCHQIILHILSYIRGLAVYLAGNWLCLSAYEHNVNLIRNWHFSIIYF